MDYIILLLLIAILVEVTYVLMRQGKPLRTTKTVLNPVFVDTSVLIDGRIIAVAESGFIGRTLYIPRSVIGELQYLADNADHEKRSRARFGLDTIKDLQNLPRAVVEIYQDGSTAKEGVDERLLALAKQHDGAVCTIDFNLNKVATVEGNEVLNINELAKRLRMAHLPGERMVIELTQKGQDNHQAIGHLEDGTMVVVEQASQKLGTFAEVEFIRSLQTAAGKMLFAKLVGTEKTKQQSKNASPRAKIKTPSKGRAPSTAQTSEKSAPASPQPPKAKTKTPAKSNGSRRSGRKDHEASLIELVNSQD